MKTLRFTLVMPFILLRISLMLGQSVVYQPTISTIPITNQTNVYARSSDGRKGFKACAVAQIDHRYEETTGLSYLYPNLPSPAHTDIIIKYFLPTSLQQASIHFFDWEGNQLLSFDILLPGKGKLVILANTLPPGIYWNTLTANGHTVDAQRMILTE